MTDDGDFKSVRRNFMFISILIFFVLIYEPTSYQFPFIKDDSEAMKIPVWQVNLFLTIFYAYYLLRYMQEFFIQWMEFLLKSGKKYFSTETGKSYLLFYCLKKLVPEGVGLESTTFKGVRPFAIDVDLKGKYENKANYFEKKYINFLELGEFFKYTFTRFAITERDFLIIIFPLLIFLTTLSIFLFNQLRGHYIWFPDF